MKAKVKLMLDNTQTKIELYRRQISTAIAAIKAAQEQEAKNKPADNLPLNS